MTTPRAGAGRVVHDLYWRELFRPGALGVFINPFYFARKGLYEGIRDLSPRVRGRILDVGCGHKPYESLFDGSAYVGLELDTPANRAGKKADLYYDGRTFPFPDHEFDSVVINQVLEHVFTPREFLAEANRVLKPGGVLLLTVPFVWDEHEQPNDYGRYSSFGLRYLLREAGFAIIEHRKSVGGGRLLFQLLSGMIYKKFERRPRSLRALAQVFLIGPINALGVILGSLLRASDDLYLDHIVTAEKRTSRVEEALT